MIFLNPWAWIGLAALAAPVAAHLLARRRATRQLFPTLRFLPLVRLAPVRRDRPTDFALLTLRCAIVAVAVGALAQPACRVRGGSPARGREIARAIVIDTSASMSRDTSPGRPALDAARREAADRAAGATISRVAESETPADLLAPSVAWLSTLSMRREIVIVSDFQTGQIESADLARIPPEIGVRPVQMAVRGDIPAPAAGRTGPVVTILAGTAEQADAGAAWQAAVARGAPVTGVSDRPVAIAFPRYESRGTLIANGRPLDRPWMFDVVGAVSTDPLSYLFANDLSWIAGDVNGRAGVILLTDAAADSLAAAALMAAAARAASGEPTLPEQVREVVSGAELAQWSREPAPTGSPQSETAAPQGRWIWAAALALLLIEGVVRRNARTTQEEGHLERAA